MKEQKEHSSRACKWVNVLALGTPVQVLLCDLVAMTLKYTCFKMACIGTLFDSDIVIHYLVSNTRVCQLLMNSVFKPCLIM